MQSPDSIGDGQRFPVSLLTGFLGSGKTTVLNHLLRQPALAKTAVIINEFGAIGLDHELVESSNEEMVLLQSGCLCCTIRGDLIETLRSLFLRRVKGEIPAFDRIVIETTGLADPAPILHTLMTDPLIAARFRLDGVITTVDAATGSDTLDRQIESVKQAAVADRLILTKVDLVPREVVQALTQRLHHLNPAAPFWRALNGRVDPSELFNAGLYNPKTKSLDVQRWLNAEAYDASANDHQHGHHDHAESHDDHHDHEVSQGHDVPHGHDVNRHDEHISAVCLTLEEPVSPDAFNNWLEVLMMLKGPDILRVKGILNLIGLDGPMVIHGVQHIFHPAVVLKAWPSADRRSRIVFIGRDLEESALRDTLKLFNGEGDGDVAAGAIPGDGAAAMVPMEARL